MVMNVSTIVVAVIVLAALFFGGRRIVRGLAGTQSCCGEMEGRKKVKKVEVSDTNEANYPYEADLPIGGMSCQGCVDNVTNALNGVKGTWATVSLKEGMAHIRAKQPIDEGAYAAAVKAAGYYVPQL